MEELSTKAPFFLIDHLEQFFCRDRELKNFVYLFQISGLPTHIYLRTSSSKY